LAILNISKKKLKNVHDNIMKFKVHDKLNLILIQQLDEEDWINSMYIQYITYSFLMTIMSHVCDS
jgi:hypothetical protein